MIPDPNAEGAVDAAALATAWHDLEQQVVRDLILAGTRPDGRDGKTLAADRVPGRAAAPDARFGRVPARRNAGPDLDHAGNVAGRAARRRAGRGVLEAVHARLQFPAVFGGRMPADPGPGPPRDRPRGVGRASVKPVLPDPEEFPYTIRVISDILESNGSSSMASVCGATLGLMAAGVPITNPVAGISVGLVKQSDDDWVLLTDILGDEDHFGDMDFKIAGTQNGITGIQLDLKIDGISEEIIRATMAQSREARMEILRSMLTDDLPAARRDLAAGPRGCCGRRSTRRRSAC